jgi:predicted TIM-barrel fold metal-dependent hydrolase
MIGGKVFRKIDSRSWDVEQRLADMVEDGTDMQVLSPMPELLSHWLPPADAEFLADVMNEQIAAMIAQAPRNFAGIGMVCAQDVPRAILQLQKVKALGFAGIEIGTHINGVALGHEKLHPLYEAAEDLGLGIFIHPLHPAGLERIGAAPEWAATAAFPLETALAAVSLLSAEVTERFPKLKILLSHGGGAVLDIAANGFWMVDRLARPDEAAAFQGRAAILVRHHSLRSGVAAVFEPCGWPGSYRRRIGLSICDQTEATRGVREGRPRQRCRSGRQRLRFSRP